MFDLDIYTVNCLNHTDGTLNNQATFDREMDLKLARLKDRSLLQCSRLLLGGYCCRAQLETFLENLDTERNGLMLETGHLPARFRYF